MSSLDQGTVGIANCYVHKGPFTFGAEPTLPVGEPTVYSLPVDPETGLPPDLGGDPDRAVEKYICPDCMKTRIEPTRVVYAIKARQEWIDQANAADTRLREQASDANLTMAGMAAVDAEAFRRWIEALHALQGETGWQVAEDLLTLAGHPCRAWPPGCPFCRHNTGH